MTSADPASYTYDAAGNVATKTINGVITEFYWDAEGRLAKAIHNEVPYTFDYDYDYQGRRVREYKDGTLQKQFVWM